MNRKRKVLKWIDDVTLVITWYPQLMMEMSERYGDRKPPFGFCVDLIAEAIDLRNHEYPIYT